MYQLRRGLLALPLLFATIGLCVSTSLKGQTYEQATVEAAIALQILNFTEWEDSEAKPGGRMIGVYDSEEAYQAFKALSETASYQGKYRVVPLYADQPSDLLSSLDAIYFPEPNPSELPKWVRRTEGYSIVLIGSFEGFLEQGGLVNLVKRQKRLSFEINLDNSKLRHISYRAKLLRLAVRVVQEDKS